MPFLRVLLLGALFIGVVVPGYANDRPGRKLSTIQRLEEKHLTVVHEAREKWGKERRQFPGTGVYQDFRAVMHVHAEDSNHTGGKRSEVLTAAKKTDVQVVMFTDHRGPKPETWRGIRDGVLFIPGAEDDGAERYPEAGPSTNVLRFIAHLEERMDASPDGFAGVEIYNRHMDLKDDGDFLGWFADVVKTPAKWEKFAELYAKYPDEIFAAGTDCWAEILRRWDEYTKARPFTGIGANDAHQNQVFNGLMLDPYEVSFRNLATHIMARELTEEAIRKSLIDGHVYVSHDWLCDASGFTFVAANNFGVYNMGDPVPIVGTTKLVVNCPVAAKVKFIKNGAVLEEKHGTNVTVETKAPGTYRVEAWLEVDGEERPWIYSNPVYLRYPDLAEMQLPSMATRAGVEVIKDVTYTGGTEDDAGKHRLDIYKPKDKSNLPVFLFIHGGSWSSGDRAQYPPLGNRYADEGILTVIPSYRLAPKHPHPAQIEDVAAAAAWVFANAEKFGGDTNRVYVGGHSAGGHLSALLALNPEYLAKHGLTQEQFAGVICLSGAYDLQEAKPKVFGEDPETRRAASPLNFVGNAKIPFLISYCEWDYFPLALQAREMNDALLKAGGRSKLVFVPKESHISEMLAVAREDDPTVKAVTEFILRKDQ